MLRKTKVEIALLSLLSHGIPDFRLQEPELYLEDLFFSFFFILYPDACS